MSTCIFSSDRWGTIYVFADYCNQNVGNSTFKAKLCNILYGQALWFKAIHYLLLLYKQRNTDVSKLDEWTK